MTLEQFNRQNLKRLVNYDRSGNLSSEWRPESCKQQRPDGSCGRDWSSGQSIIISSWSRERALTLSGILVQAHFKISNCINLIQFGEFKIAVSSDQQVTLRLTKLIGSSGRVLRWIQEFKSRVWRWANSWILDEIWLLLGGPISRFLKKLDFWIVMGLFQLSFGKVRR